MNGGARRVIVSVLAIAGAASLSWPVAPVEAETPVLQTWWTTRNLTIDLPIPTLVPVPPVTLPSDDVPDGGSEVAGTGDQAIGLATFRYEFPEGSTVGDLVLVVADEVAATPATSLVACPLAGDGTFQSVPGGGPIGRAPAYECDRGVEGVLDEGAGTWRFPVPALVEGDHLAVAVVAQAGRVVFERARSDSLEVVRPAEVPLPAGPRPVVVPDAAPVESSASAPRPVVVAPAPAVPSAPGAPQAPIAAPAVPTEQAITFGAYEGDGERIGSTAFGAFGVLIAAAVGWRRNRRSLLAL